MLRQLRKRLYMLYFNYIRKHYSANVFLFSSPYGYQDNAKSLMDYYQKKGMITYWVSKKRKLSLKKNQLFRNSLFLKLILPRVKICFITHESTDILQRIPGSILIVNLWHGIALKKMGYDSDIDKINMRLNDIKNPYTKNNFVISSSNTTKKHMQSCMNLPHDSVLPFGQPRTDILFNKSYIHFKKSKIKKESYSIYKSIYLYAPTFRDSGSPGEIYKEVVNSFIKHADKDDLLILRLHPREKSEAKKIALLASNIITSKYSDPINDLLVADALISDYSSIIFDYMILSRPIFLFTPDIKEYTHYRSGFYFNYENIMDGAFIFKHSFERQTWNKDFLNDNYEYPSANFLHTKNAASQIYNFFNSYY